MFHPFNEFGLLSGLNSAAIIGSATPSASHMPKACVPGATQREPLARLRAMANDALQTRDRYAVKTS
jgi:hypothetical protein